MKVWREQVEAEFETWIKPYRDALEATKSSAYMGQVTESEVADLELRIQAAEKVFDRVFGKPTQPTEVSGSLDLRGLMLGDTGSQLDE